MYIFQQAIDFATSRGILLFIIYLIAFNAALTSISLDDGRQHGRLVSTPIITDLSRTQHSKRTQYNNVCATVKRTLKGTYPSQTIYISHIYSPAHNRPPYIF